MILSHRRWSIFVSILAIALCAVSAPAQDAASGEWTQTEEQWYSLELDEVKAGWMYASVSDNGQRYRTQTVMKMVIKRADGSGTASAVAAGGSNSAAKGLRSPRSKAPLLSISPAMSASTVGYAVS